jgi:hypothetical protein
MTPDFHSQQELTWEAIYEKAITEANPDLRRQRLLEAQKAILDRAATLEDERGDHQAEAEALEEAADFLREMKAQTQTDGVAMELKVGDKEAWPKKAPTRRGPPKSNPAMD